MLYKLELNSCPKVLYIRLKQVLSAMHVHRSVYTCSLCFFWQRRHVVGSNYFQFFIWVALLLKMSTLNV